MVAEWLELMVMQDLATTEDAPCEDGQTRQPHNWKGSTWYSTVSTSLHFDFRADPGCRRRHGHTRSLRHTQIPGILTPQAPNRTRRHRQHDCLPGHDNLCEWTRSVDAMLQD